MHLACSYKRNAAQGVAQVFLLVSDWCSSAFPVLRRVVWIENAFAPIGSLMGVLV